MTPFCKAVHLSTRTIVACLTILLAGIPSVTSAQATNSSTQHVVLQSERSNGTTSRSSTYVLRGSSGSGPAATQANSANYQLEGGFPATLSTTVPNRPWLTAVRPQVTSINQAGTLTLHGTHLDLGQTPRVRIGATAVTVATRQRDRIAVTIPRLTVPGWQPVTLTTSIGETTLTKGLAVLPLIETRPAPGLMVPVDLVFRGTKGDQVLWVMGIAPGPLIRLPGIRYGFGLLPPVFIIYSGFKIDAANGELKLTFPATQYGAGITFLQGLFIGNSGQYAPAAFSNVLRI